MRKGGAWSAVLIGLVVFESRAFAEEELRIALSSGNKQVRVGGVGLTIFDADVGDAVARLPKNTPATIERDGKTLKIRARVGKPAKVRTVARARRVFVEAKDAVQVDRGVYFGRIEVTPKAKGAGLMVVNRLRLETYLLGIVGSEMNPDWPIEALKAQAVAARTYAMQRRAMMRATNRPYDLASTVISQVYKGAERIRPSVIEAVKQTRGEVLSNRHDLVEALFHSTCGGKTVRADVAFGNPVPYLITRWCKWCRDSHRYKWDVSFKLTEVSRRLNKAKLTKGKVVDVRRSSKDRSVRVKDSRGWRTIKPRSMRRALGFGVLFSERFTAKTDRGRVRLQGRGFGHGVGMCQWGARGQALAGRNHREILAHYYPGTKIRRLY